MNGSIDPRILNQIDLSNPDHARFMVEKSWKNWDLLTGRLMTDRGVLNALYDHFYDGDDETKVNIYTMMHPLVRNGSSRAEILDIAIKNMGELRAITVHETLQETLPQKAPAPTKPLKI